MLRFISLIKLVLSEAKKISGDTLQPALVIRLLGSCSWVVCAGPPVRGRGQGSLLTLETRSGGGMGLCWAKLDSI